MAVTRVPQDSAAFSRKHARKSSLSHLTSESRQTEVSPAFEAHSFQQVQQEADIAELFSLVRESGQRLIRLPSWEHACDYRDRITRLLSQVVSTSFTVQRHESHENHSKKRYTAVTQVKEQVDAIVRYFLNSEKTALNILNRVQEIEGLLVDIIS